MNAILSVNCALVCGIQRLLGDAYFSLVARSLFKSLIEMHPIATGAQNSATVEKDQAKDRVKNLVNCFLHFFLF
jgi:hypothetical protein